MASTPPPPGHMKVTLNFLMETWHGYAGKRPGLREHASYVGLDPVCIIEALVNRYLNGSDDFQSGVETEAEQWRRHRKKVANHERRRGARYGRNMAKLAGNPSGLRCVYCGRQADTWDHVHPKTLGGSDEAANRVPACRSCNSSKGSKTDWRPQPERLFE